MDPNWLQWQNAEKERGPHVKTDYNKALEKQQLSKDPRPYSITKILPYLALGAEREVECRDEHRGRPRRRCRRTPPAWQRHPPRAPPGSGCPYPCI
jgi:hypothetical protein